MLVLRIPAGLALAFALGACVTAETSSLSSRPRPADAHATNAAAPAPAAATSPEANKEDPPPKKAPLARAELGKPAPEFELKDIDGKTVRLASFKGRTVVLEWFSPTCPYCVYAYGEKGPLRTLPERLAADRVVWLSICSEDPANPGGSVETMKEFVKAHEMKAPLLVDAAGTVGRAFGAKSTPHMFVISEKGVLVYQGALDNAPLGKAKDEGLRVNYVEKALADLRSGHAVTIAETKSYG
jgi:peroxiredoxin